MGKIDYDILSLFKGHPNVELSTSDIVSSLYSKEYSELQNTLSDSLSSKEQISLAKQSIAKLHRRALHHASQLVKDGSLLISKVEGRGKKYYTLALNEGEELVIDKYKKKLIITRPNKPLLPLGDLEDKQIVYLPQKNSFFERVNAVLLSSVIFSSPESLYSHTYSLFPQVNDVIAINDFEHLIENSSIPELIVSLHELDSEANSYNRRVCCIIDFTNILSSSKIISFFSLLFDKPLSNIVFVYDATSRELLQQNTLVELLIEMYANKKQKLNIKNDDLHKPPYFLGKHGPYTIPVKDWEKYSADEELQKAGIVCTQSSIIFDVSQAKKINSSAKSISDSISQVAKALFVSNTYQRKYSSDLYKKLSAFSNSSLSSVFSYSSNYIRFWNYEDEDEDVLLELLSTCKEDCTSFAKMQETIYLSCGMPVRFSLGFSIAYRNSQDGEPLTKNFDQLYISGLKDFYSADFKERMTFYEKAASLFSIGFEIRFTRTGVIEVMDVLSELSFILNSFSIPFFCYHFSETVGANKKLDMFMT